MPLNHIRSTVLALAVAVALAAALTPVASAGPAPPGGVGDEVLTQEPTWEPAPDQDGILNIDYFEAAFRVDPSYDNHPAWKFVDFDGLMSLNSADAAEFFHGYHVTGRYQLEYRVMGDDPGSDSLLMSSGASSLNILSRPNGFWIGGHISVQSKVLNEDQSWFDNRDEVYGEVRLLDHTTGQTVRSLKTNVVTGYF
jgi:hypothetical protein